MKRPCIVYFLNLLFFRVSVTVDFALQFSVLVQLRKFSEAEVTFNTFSLAKQADTLQKTDRDTAL